MSFSQLYLAVEVCIKLLPYGDHNSDHDLLVVEPYPSEKYEFVNWDDDIPNSHGKIFKMFQTTNQMMKPEASIPIKIPLNHHFLMVFLYFERLQPWLVSNAATNLH